MATLIAAAHRNCRIKIGRRAAGGLRGSNHWVKTVLKIFEVSVDYYFLTAVGFVRLIAKFRHFFLCFAL